MSELSIGILGGSFDPLHNGHVLMAQEAQNQLGLDRIILMPCFVSPHKQMDQGASARQRLEALTEFAKGYASWSVSDWEVQKGTVSYSIDTLRYLKTMHPSDQLYWIMGQDQWCHFKMWKDYQEIVKLARIAICQRSESDQSITNDLEGCYQWINMPLMPQASREIRDKVGLGESIQADVPACIERWIEREQLYKEKRQ